MMDSSAVWDSQDPTLSVASQDDFQQFLDMGMSTLGDSLQFDFQDYNHQQGHGSQLMHQNDGDQIGTRMDEGHGAMGHDITMHEHMPSMSTAGSHPTIPGPIDGEPSGESIVELDAQIQYLQQRRQQQQQQQMQEQQRNYYAQNRMIPPTPNSMELHGQFYPQSDPQHQAMYERYRMQAKDQEVSRILDLRGSPGTG
jgi:hypothetical protein